MKTIITDAAFMKFTTFVLALLLGSAAQAADLDVLLQQIKTDIAANRLSTPAGNNALERIDAFREQAPFDYRVIPLMYQWGDAYLRLADEAMDNGDVDKANLYLQRVWQVASLTPGLEQAQARLDQLASTTQQVAQKDKKQAQKKDQAAEAERQRRIAAAAAEERARLERERQRRLEQARREAEAEKQRLIAERKKREEEERRSRAEAQKAAQLAAQQPQASAVVAQAEPASPEEVESARELWEQAEEDRPPLAKYDLNGGMISDRNREIGDTLEPICRAILDNDASVVIHTEDKSDYRWLTVRLTLCLRRLDDSFRLRHSFETLAQAEPFLTLHPPREVSLVRKAAD
jgi:colicin import membrane protein